MQNLELRLVTDFFGQLEFIFKRREKCVPFHFAFDDRQVKVGAAGQRLLVNLRAAADEDVVREFRRVELVHRVENQNFRLFLFAQLGEMELIRALEIAPAAPLVVLPENLRMAFDEPLRMPRQHHVLAVLQRLAEALERLAPHHDHVAHRHFLEPLEILRQMPRDFAARANHAVQRHRGDGFEMFHKSNFIAGIPECREKFSTPQSAGQQHG